MVADRIKQLQEQYLAATDDVKNTAGSIHELKKLLSEKG